MANKEVEKDDAVISPITTTCSYLTEENNLAAEEIQKEPEDSERRDPLVSISEILVATEPGAPRSQDNVSPSQQQTMPCKTETTNKGTLIGLLQKHPSLSAAWKH